MRIGGHAMFLGSQDIQLGVNESLLDTSKVVSSMVDGIMARVGAHSEIEVTKDPNCDLFFNQLDSSFFLLFSHPSLISSLSPPLEPLDLGKILDSTNYQCPFGSVSSNPDLGRSDDPS